MKKPAYKYVRKANEDEHELAQQTLLKDVESSCASYDPKIRSLRARRAWVARKKRNDSN